jgi:uncharacterized surface protein with fasciclin (FAS1) repeats
MKKFTQTISKLTLGASLLLFGAGAFGQTVFAVINGSSEHTTLRDAILAAELDGALNDPNGEFTVFAPDNDAFDDVLTELGLTPAQLLASADLADILLYHVLSGATVNSSDLSNGQIETPMNNANTLKFTVTGGGNVFVNQAQVNDPDMTASNGVVHSIDAVVLENETVVDIALGSLAHTTLVQAVVAAELLPALTNPFADLTVFAPTNDAFADALAELDLTPAQLLASADLADILLYHVLGIEVESEDLTNGQIAQPLNTSNTIKITVTSDDDVYANQAQVTTPDLKADNGVVHVLDAVILPYETVVDIALGSTDHTALVAAVIAAELLPALTDPFNEFTVFAPTNAAFADAAAALGVTLTDVLGLSFLDNILLYHVVGGTVLSTDLTNGPVTTLNGEDVVVDLTSGVLINQANVTTPDLVADNGVVHVIDAVLLPEILAVDETLAFEKLVAYPNPTADILNVTNLEGATFTVVSLTGAIVAKGNINNGMIDVQSLNEGTYLININDNQTIYQGRFVKM